MLLYTPASPCPRWLGNLARGGGVEHAGKRHPRVKLSHTCVLPMSQRETQYSIAYSHPY
jgi:hypothetical protein